MSEEGERRRVRLNAIVTRDGAWYVAQCVEVDIASQGATAEEALANLREALELYLEDRPAPPTAQPMVAQVEVQIPA